MILVTASSNPHKIAELKRLLAGTDVVSAQSMINHPFNVDETGLTFEENAYIKAKTLYDIIGRPVIADDSGLIVESLNGAPGVNTARYAGTNARDADNRALLMQNLSGHDDRSARFRCVLCFVDDMRTMFAEGDLLGTIATEERGSNGFGYDSLFIPEGHFHTFAEMSADAKDKLSHRAQAANRLLIQLQSLGYLGEATLSTKERPLDVNHLRLVLVTASLCVITRNDAALHRILTNNVSIPGALPMLYECFLQLHLFSGFPTALEALKTLKLFHSKSPALDRDALCGNDADNLEKGLSLCNSVYGEVTAKMLTAAREASPELSEWLVRDGYGKTLSRPGLDMLSRELCVVAVLACQGYMNQLYSHMRGAIRFGATAMDFDSVEDALAIFSSRTALENYTTVRQRLSC